MKVTTKIRRFLARLAPDEIFSTSQLLAFGSRSAVDQAMFRLVRFGVVHRLARGLFILSGRYADKVTAAQVAAYKAAAFGHKIARHSRDLAQDVSILVAPNEAMTFASSGSSSSFLFHNCNQRIYFKHASAKKLRLSGSKAGDWIRALWQTGRGGCDAKMITHVCDVMGRTARDELPKLAGLMPTWLHKKFRWRSIWIPPRLVPVDSQPLAP